MQAHHASTTMETILPDQAGETVLRTKDLTKHYGSRLAVNRLNLEVRRGEIVGFLGPNGAGKTTTGGSCSAAPTIMGAASAPG